MLKRLHRLGSELRRETGAALRQGRLIALPPRSATVAGPAASHALFVHGFLAHGRVFAPLREHIERHTGRSTSEVSYGPLERFEDVAERVAEALRKNAQRGKVAAVGHSLGGLILRWAVQELGASAYVDRLVTVATPHRGTRAARVGVVPLARAIAPDSAIIERLHASKDRIGNIPHLALVAERDRMVVPPSSAAHQDAEVHWLEGVGHNEMLFHPEVFRRVALALRK